MSNPASDLFELRNFYFLGNYQAAINEANSLPASSLREQDRLERDVYLYRSFLAQGKYNLVLSEIADSAPIPLRAVKLLASYLNGGENEDKVAAQVKEWLKDGVAASNPLFQIVAASIYYHLGSFEEAMRCVYQTKSLEGLAMLVQIYLRINRVDQAEKELKTLQQIDDDATITQLATAWVSMSLGSDRVNEGYQILQQLSDRYGTTASLFNGMGVCCLQMKNYAEAEQNFLHALEKNPSDTDAIVNLITSYQHQNKSTEVINRQINQLRSINPNHPFLVSMNKLDTDFDRLQAQFSIS